MFKLKKLLQFGVSLGGGKSSGRQESGGTRTGKAVDLTKTRQQSKQTGRNVSQGATSQQTAGTTATTGRQASTSATQQSSATRGATRTSGINNVTGSSTTAQDTAQRGNISSRTTGTTGTTGTVQGNLQQTLSSLDTATQNRLLELVSAISSPEDAAALQGTLTDRALNADVSLAAGTDAIISSARRSGTRAIGAQETNLAKAAGSTQNSLVAQIGLEAQVDLETELASLRSSLETQNRQIATGELQGALGGTVGNTATLADILKGATQTTEQVSGQTSGQQQVVDQNVNQSTVNTGTVTGRAANTQAQVNQSTQIVDQSTTSTALTQAEQQNQQIVDALQSILGTSSNVDISTLLNDVLTSSERDRAISEAFQTRGRTSGKQIGVGLSGGIG